MVPSSIILTIMDTDHIIHGMLPGGQTAFITGIIILFITQIIIITTTIITITIITTIIIITAMITTDQIITSRIHTGQTTIVLQDISGLPLV